MGGWGKVEDKDHLSQTETDIGAELGNCKYSKHLKLNKLADFTQSMIKVKCN